MNDESISTYTLNALCHILNCDISDIMKFYPDLDNETEKNSL